MIGCPMVEIAGIEYFKVRLSFFCAGTPFPFPFLPFPPSHTPPRTSAHTYNTNRIRKQGLGGYCYLGTGGVVIGYAPAIEMIALKNEHFDFYFAVRFAFSH